MINVRYYHLRMLKGTVLLLLTVPFSVAGCRSEQTATGQSAEVNMLTEMEEAEGWELLFDGKTLDKWRGYKWDTVPPNWTVEEGTITCSPCVGSGANLPGDWKPSNDLITKDQFQNFDLKIDWKISPSGNSGIFYRVLETYDHPYTTGPEVQILDNVRHKDRLNGPDRSAGASYDVYAPSKDVTRPAGEWNESRIIVDSTHVEHWLNGTKIVEYELFSEDWERRVAESKWASNPDYGRMKTGHIGLQDHDDAVWFRNIKIKRLPDTRTLP